MEILILIGVLIVLLYWCRGQRKGYNNDLRGNKIFISMFLHTTIEYVSIGKTVFITGCDSGFGYSLALHSAEIGMKVCHDSALLFWLIDLTFK